MKYIFLLIILIITILLGGFYSENMDTYVMKNAFVNTNTGAGRFTKIDTDGNFSSTYSDVVLSNMNQENVPLPTKTIPTTTIPMVISTESSQSSDNTKTQSGWIQGLVR